MATARAGSIGPSWPRKAARAAAAASEVFSLRIPLPAYGRVKDRLALVYTGDDQAVVERLARWANAMPGVEVTVVARHRPATPCRYASELAPAYGGVCVVDGRLEELDRKSRRA